MVPVAVFSTKTPASKATRSLPEPRRVSPRTTAPGAATKTTLPRPSPSITGVPPPLERDLPFDPHATAMLAFDDDRVTVRRAIQRGLE